MISAACSSVSAGSPRRSAVPSPSCTGDPRPERRCAGAARAGPCRSHEPRRRPSARGPTVSNIHGPRYGARPHVLVHDRACSQRGELRDPVGPVGNSIANRARAAGLARIRDTPRRPRCESMCVPSRLPVAVDATKRAVCLARRGAAAIEVLAPVLDPLVGVRPSRRREDDAHSSRRVNNFCPKPPPTSRMRDPDGAPACRAAARRVPAHSCGFCVAIHSVQRPGPGSQSATMPRVSIGTGMCRCCRNVRGDDVVAPSKQRLEFGSGTAEIISARGWCRARGCTSRSPRLRRARARCRRSAARSSMSTSTSSAASSAT